MATPLVPDLKRPSQLTLIPPPLTCLLIRPGSSHQGSPSSGAARRRCRCGLLPVACDPGVGSCAHALGRVTSDAPARRTLLRCACLPSAMCFTVVRERRILVRRPPFWVVY